MHENLFDKIEFLLFSVGLFLSENIFSELMKDMVESFLDQHDEKEIQQKNIPTIDTLNR